eukprot:UC4_evm1s474
MSTRKRSRIEELDPLGKMNEYLNQKRKKSSNLHAEQNATRNFESLAGEPRMQQGKETKIKKKRKEKKKKKKKKRKNDDKYDREHLVQEKIAREQEADRMIEKLHRKSAGLSSPNGQQYSQQYNPARLKALGR